MIAINTAHIDAYLFTDYFKDTQTATTAIEIATQR